MKTIGGTISLPAVLTTAIVAVIAEARLLNVLGILLGHWVYPQAYAGAEPPINPFDPLIGTVLLATLALGAVLFRRYRSLALGLMFSVPITWVLIAMVYQGSLRGGVGQNIASGGLGITRLEFERLHNLPTKVIPDPRWARELSYNQGNGYYQINLWYNGPQAGPEPGIQAQTFETSLIRSIAFDRPGKSRAEVLTEVRNLLPVDAVLKETREKMSEGTGRQWVIIDTYESKSLAKRYPPLPSIPDPWKGRTPGTVFVITSPEGTGSGGTGASIYADLISLPRLEPPQPTRPLTKTPFNSLTPEPPPKPVYTVPMPEPSYPVPIPTGPLSRR